MSIREALHELDVWGASVVFALTEYKDCRGATVKLIKDWKDLTNKVELYFSNRTLLTSLIFRWATISVFCSPSKTRHITTLLQPRFLSDFAFLVETNVL